VNTESDLRKILSQNIKAIRRTLHISQAKLSEYANISLSYLTDIERCRTWVSDKTLQNLAKALNREAWELLIPIGEQNRFKTAQRPVTVQREQAKYIAEVIVRKKEALRRIVNKTMEELVIEIVKGK